MTTIQPIAPAQTYALRHQVLWPDKPAAYVRLPDDDAGHHFGAFLVDGRLVAVISLFVDGAEARFRKFATHPAFQGRGIGAALLAHTVAAAKQLGANVLWCDSRQATADFYRRFGMAPEGEVFYKGPIPYVRMRRVGL